MKVKLVIIAVVIAISAFSIIGYRNLVLPRVDQFQLKHDTGNDWAEEQVGQIFKASRDGKLVGVKIKTKVRSKRGPVPGQRPLRINLLAVGPGDVLNPNILATGLTTAINYAGDDYEWRSIIFDIAYEQKRGEKLAIILGRTEKVTPHAWHDVAFTKTDSYPDGIMWFNGRMGSGGFKEYNGDLAFQTVVAPANPRKTFLSKLLAK